MDKNAMKKMAAERSVDFVEDNMILGLGTGSTVVYMVEALQNGYKQNTST